MGSWEDAGGVPVPKRVRHGDCLSVSLAVAGISLTFQLVQYQNQSHETTRSDMDSYELRCWSLWAKQMRARRILQAPARQRIVCAPSAHWLAEKFVCFFFAFLESFSVLCKYWKVLQWYYSVLQSTTPYTKVVPSTTKYCSVLQSTTPH